MGNDYDVIVVGAGNGGLSTAALTAKNGLRTLVVERQILPGGAASSIVRGRFEFETALHELGGIGTVDNPGGIRQIFDSVGADIDWHCYMDETFRLIVPEEGIDAFLPCGIEPFCQKMVELVPDCGEAMKKFIDLGLEASGAILMTNDLACTEEAINEKYPNFFGLTGLSVKEGMDSIGMPEKAQKILATYWVYLGTPMTMLDFASYSSMTVQLIIFGAGMPKYRSNEIMLALEKVVRDNGGDIWHNTEVDQIIVKDGKACGIVTGGKEYYAEYIVSNVYPDIVYGKMIDRKELPDRAVQLVNSREHSIAFMTIYLGMNKSAEELGLDCYTNFVGVTSDDVKQYEGCVDTYEYPEYNIFNCLNVVIPDCTPEGTCQLYFSIPYGKDAWGSLSGREYFKQKNKVALEAIKHVEKAMNLELLPYIEEIEIATPVTFSRYLNSPGGTPYGYLPTKTDGFTYRWASLKEESFVKDLFFVGASSHKGDGYSYAYLSALYTLTQIIAAQMQKGGNVR